MTQDHLPKKEIEWRGIKCDVPNKVRDHLEHGLAEDMQRKQRVGGYFDKRNGISTASLGDKPYKASNYAADFYKEPGLVPGSSMKTYPKNMARKKQIDFTVSKSAKWPMKPREVWADKVRREEKQIDVDSVAAADRWEAERDKVKAAAASATTAKPGDTKAGGGKKK